MESIPTPTDTARAFPGDRAPEAKPASMRHTWLWQPNLIVFTSSACIMILELVAGRIIAPYVGVSLYTWTSVIGVVLAGISLGNYLGGRLADRWASLRLLGGIFMLGGLLSFGILAVDVLGRVTPGDWPIVVEILVLTTALFLVPCVILGTISPVVAKLTVRDLAKTGSTVGKIYASGTAGSIVGTFATGFLLISWFGTHTIVWGVALVLLALGLLFLLSGRWQLMLLFALILASGSMLAFRRGWLRGPCTRETNYFCIKVQEEERDGEPVRVLILDRLVQSYTSLNDPTRLVYGYERMYAEVTAFRTQRDDHLRALFIGGGGYTFDLVMGDAFNDFSVPYHLTTKEFNDRVRAWLEDDGLYFVNIIDGPRGDFLRAYTHTLRQTFRHVYLAPTIESWRQSPRSTFVLIASDAPLDLVALKTIDAGDGDPFLARQMISQKEIDALLTEGRVVMLTDQYAPVDQMLAPVFRDGVTYRFRRVDREEPEYRKLFFDRLNADGSPRGRPVPIHLALEKDGRRVKMVTY